MMKLAGLLLACCLPVIAQAQCRLSLQLALDVSGSVDAREYRQQLDGLAWALDDADVRAALLAMPTAPVAISIFEWSGRADQRVVSDWWLVQSDADIDALTLLLRSTARRKTSVSTGIGTAMVFAHARLSTAPRCARHVVDISGDGKNNDGPRPQDVRDNLVGIMVNGLVVAPAYGDVVGAMAFEAEELIAYFRANVILGPGAFVEVAHGYGDYAESMKRKLLRELEVISMSGLTR